MWRNTCSRSSGDALKNIDGVFAFDGIDVATEATVDNVAAHDEEEDKEGIEKEVTEGDASEMAPGLDDFIFHVSPRSMVCCGAENARGPRAFRAVQSEKQGAIR